MNNASTPDGRGQDRPHDAKPFFPSEGSFNPVVPLSEIGHASPLFPTVGAADVGRPAEAAWAREAHRARSKEDEETLVPSRARRSRGARPSWLVTASVIVLSVTAGLASGVYLVWSSQRAPEAQAPAAVAAEAPSLPPAPVEADKRVEPSNEPTGDLKPREVAKAESPNEVAHASKPEPPARVPSPPRAAAEPKAVTPAPQPARTQSAPPSRPRPTTAEKQPPATPARTLPVSSPPPSARSKSVIQWP